jgi:hypothetical protein
VTFGQLILAFPAVDGCSVREKRRSSTIFIAGGLVAAAAVSQNHIASMRSLLAVSRELTTMGAA